MYISLWRDFFVKISRVIVLFVAIFMVAGAILACGQLGLSNQSNEPAWTPPASTGAPGRSVQGGDVLPTVPATEALPLVAALPFATAEPETTLPPTADPHHVVITEN